MSIADEFKSATSARASKMKVARECSAYTIPSVLPYNRKPQGMSEIPRPWQSLGAEGVTNVTGKSLVALFTNPWFAFNPSVKFKSQVSDPAQVRIFEDYLLARELLVIQKLNASKLRTKMRTALEHVFILGDTLIQITDDCTFKVFRLDQWVKKLASDNSVLLTIVCEAKDPVQLTDEDLSKAGLVRSELERKTGKDRDLKLYTRCKLQSDKKWLVEQELNGEIIRTSEETVSPFITPGYVEVAGENYSRSLVEECLGNLRAYNELWKDVVEGLTIAVRVIPVVDPTKGYEPEDMTRPNGEVIEGRVVDNRPDGMGFARVEKAADLSMGMEGIREIKGDLGRKFLLQSSAQRDAERVTATEVMKVAKELDGALGGVYAEIADELQRPIIDRVVHVMEKNNEMVALPKEFQDLVNTEVLTGLEAMGRQMNLERITTALQILAPFQSEMQRVKTGQLAADVFAGLGLDPDRHLMNDEELQAKQQAEMQAQLQAQAGQQAVSTVGVVAEEAAKQAAKGAA